MSTCSDHRPYCKLLTFRRGAVGIPGPLPERAAGARASAAALGPHRQSPRETPQAVQRMPSPDTYIPPQIRRRPELLQPPLPLTRHLLQMAPRSPTQLNRCRGAQRSCATRKPSWRTRSRRRWLTSAGATSRRRRPARSSQSSRSSCRWTVLRRRDGWSSWCAHRDRRSIALGRPGVKGSRGSLTVNANLFGAEL